MGIDNTMRCGVAVGGESGKGDLLENIEIRTTSGQVRAG